MLAFKDIPPTARQQLLLLFGTALLFWTGIGILMPTLPIHLESAGFNRGAIGLITGAFALGLILSRPYLGQLADRRGRQIVLLIGTTIAASAPLGYLLWQHLWPLLGLRIYHGVSIAAFTTAYSALVADIAPPASRGQVIGYMSLANPVGIAVGPAIGGLLLITPHSFVAIFSLSAALGLVSCLLGASLQETPRAAVVPSVTNQDHWWQTLVAQPLLVPTLVLLLVGFPFGALHTFVALYITASAVVLNPGLFFTAAALASFLSRFFLGRATDRFGRGVFIAASLLVYSGAMGVLATADSASHFLLAAILEGLSVGTLLPTIVTLITDRCPPQQRGSVLSVSLMGLDVGVAIAAPVFGLIVPQIGYPGIFGLGVGLSFLSFLLFCGWVNPTIQSSLGFVTGRTADKFALDRSTNLDDRLSVR